MNTGALQKGATGSEDERTKSERTIRQYDHGALRVLSGYGPALIVLVLFLVIWEAVTRGGLMPSNMLPAPSAIVQAATAWMPAPKRVKDTGTSPSTAAWAMAPVTSSSTAGQPVKA